MGEPLLELLNVQTGYQGQDILKDINLTIRSGELIAVIGPNGCGKSTLLRAMSRHIPVTRGSITLNNKPLNTWTTAEIATQVALLPQSRDIPILDVETFVAHGRFPYRGLMRRLSQQDKAHIEQAIKLMGIDRLRQANLHDLSGGERQKAYLAMLLAQDADLLLLDEPTTFLDPGFQLEILDILQQLHRQGKTIVMVLHDLVHALSLADRVVLMAAGRVKSDAAPQTLVESGLIDQVFQVSLKRHELGHETVYAIRPLQAHPET